MKRPAARRWLAVTAPLLALIPAYCAGKAVGEGMSPGVWRLGGPVTVLATEPAWRWGGERPRQQPLRTLRLRESSNRFAQTEATARFAPVPSARDAPPIRPRSVAQAGPVIDLPPTTETPVVDPRNGNGDRNLVELRLGAFASRTARGLLRNGELLVQLEPFGDLLELPYRDSAGYLRLLLPASRGVLSADSSTGAVTTPRGLTTNVLVLEDRKHYVPLPIVAEAVGVEARFDPEQQLVMILPSPELPAVRRIRRDRARRRLEEQEQQAEPSYAAASLVGNGWTGLAMDYDLAASSLEPNTITSYDFDVASRFWGGTATVGVRGTSQASSAVLDGAWTRVWGDGALVRQLRLGDGPGSGPRPASSRGFLVTNAPPYRPLIVEALPFAGTLDPGWSIEAYRNGSLVAFDSTSQAGRYEITLPIHYGENPVDFVAYGPLGEVRTFNQTFRALPNMLPSGSIEYAVSGGACRIECGNRGNGDLRIGVDRRVTTRAGMEYESRDGRAYWTPYAGILAHPVNSVGIELETVRHGFDRGTLRYEPTAAVRTTFDYVTYSRQASTRRLGAPGRESEVRASGRFARHRDGSGLAMELAASHFNDETGHLIEARAGLSVPRSNMLLRPYVRAIASEYSTIERTQTFAGTEVTVLPRPQLGSVFGKMWLRGQGEIGVDGTPELAAFTLIRNVFPRVRMEAGYRWQRNVPGSAIWLGVVSELSAVRYSARAMSVVGAESDRIEQSLGGSAIWDKYGGRVLFSAEPATDRTGVTGTVFLDTNADGKRQKDEPLLPGVRVLTPGHAMTTDSLGRFQLWGLQAFEPVPFSVDTASLPDPHYIPHRAGVVVTPELGQLSVIEMPVDVGAILEGRLDLAPDAPAPNRSLRLVLTDQATGTVRTVETFQDGSFYIMGVRPGRYRLTVDPAMLRAAGLRSEPIDVVVPIPPGPAPKSLRPRIRSLVIALLPADPATTVAHTEQ